MKLTIDFDNETVTTDQGTIVSPGIKNKESEIIKLLGLEIISGEELKEDINNLFDELGLSGIVGV